MPPVTTSLAPVIAAQDSKESGVTKVYIGGESLGRGLGPREIPVGMTGFHKDSLRLSFIQFWKESRRGVLQGGRWCRSLSVTASPSSSLTSFL